MQTAALWKPEREYKHSGDAAQVGPTGGRGVERNWESQPQCCHSAWKTLRVSHCLHRPDDYLRDAGLGQ